MNVGSARREPARPPARAHGSALLASGEDLAAVSRRLGHGSVAVTAEVYSHLLDDAERRRARRARLDGLYGASTEAAV